MATATRPHVACAAIAAGCLAVPLAAPGDTLFVSAFTGGRIDRFDLPSNTATTVVSGLSSPEDGACSPGGQIYFAQSFSGIIERYNQDGSGATNIVPAAGAIAGPEGLSFDPAGNLYSNTRNIAGGADGAWRLDGGDPANPILQIVPPYTSFGEGSDIVLAGPHQGALLLVARGEITVFKSEPPGAPVAPFIAPSNFPLTATLYGIASNGCGELFVPVTDIGGGFIYRFDPEGAFKDVYASGFQRPSFLDFDSDGNLYVTDSDASAVYKVAPNRTVTLFATVSGTPTGLAICRDRPVPTCITCDAGGPYSAECAGGTTCVALDASNSFDIYGGPLTFAWTSNCPGATFDSSTGATPQLCVDSAGLGCAVDCTATVAVDNGSVSESCTADVRIEDTLPPAVLCALRPRDPEPPSSPGSPGSPQPPSSATSARVEVVCSGSDACDPAPSVVAQIVLSRHVVENGTCTERTETVPVACGELLDLVRLAPPCLARPPRSPRPPPSAGSDGVRVLAGEDIRLEVRATDACGLQSDPCVDVATVPRPPRPPRCASSLVCR